MIRMKLAPLCACLALAACGGGGGDDEAGFTPGPTSPGVATAEGYWTGNLASTPQTERARLLVTADGSFWMIGGGITGDNLTTWSHGSASWNGSRMTGAGTNFYTSGQTSGPTDIEADYAAGGSMTADVSRFAHWPVQRRMFLTYSPSYNAPATLASIEGTWPMAFYRANGAINVSTQISAAGAITGTSATCSWSGTVAPSASGKGYFTLNVTFSGTQCNVAGTLQGVAMLEPEGATSTLAVVVRNSDGSNGVIGRGKR